MPASMRLSFRHSLWLAAWCCLALFYSAARSRAQQAPTVALTNAVEPTVTAAMGDRGGKFFGQTPDPAKTRRYFIAAEPVLWDYAPLGEDPICGKPLPPPIVAKRRGGKLRYVQYTDETFTSKVRETPRLGIMGPVLRGTVGEFLSITFLNRVARPLSMHPHGVKYDKDSEGSHYQPKPGLGAAVGNGAKFTYVWQLDEESGPMPSEPASKGWLYHSHVEGDEESELGLVGFIVVTDPKRARPDGTPNDTDREMATLFMIHDESGIGAAMKEALEYGAVGMNMPQLTWAQIEEQTELGSRVAMSGYVFGNLPGLEMNEGERVRWYLFGLGSKEDFHTAHWHGLRVTEEGRRRTDVVELLPASMKVADMLADNPGTWLYHCHVAEHMMEGMFARVIVHPKGSNGVSRAPEQAFFGLRSGEQSLHLKRIEATISSAPNAAQPCEIKLEGAVTVFDAFSVFTQPVVIQFGERTASFKPDRRGSAATAEGKFRALNASQYGVVYGGTMEFEMTLTGAGWMEGLRKLGLPASGSGELPTTMTLHVGNARHTGAARIIVRSK